MKVKCNFVFTSLFAIISCALGKTAFEKLTELDYRGTTYYTIRNLTLWECQGWCKEEVECSAASFSFVLNPLAPVQDTLCLLQNKTVGVNPTATPQRAVSLYYMIKLDIKSDHVCNRPWNFERVPNKMIRHHDDWVAYTSTKEACLAECLNKNAMPLKNRKFTCRSAEYNYVTMQCNLSASDRRSVSPEVELLDVKGVDYFENLCLTAENSCKEDRDYAEPKLGIRYDKVAHFVDLRYYVDKEFMSNTLEGCKRACELESDFLCRSFLHKGPPSGSSYNCQLFHLDHHVLPEGPSAFLSTDIPLLDDGSSIGKYKENICQATGITTGDGGSSDGSSTTSAGFGGSSTGGQSGGHTGSLSSGHTSANTGSQTGGHITTSHGGTTTNVHVGSQSASSTSSQSGSQTSSSTSSHTSSHSSSHSGSQSSSSTSSHTMSNGGSQSSGSTSSHTGSKLTSGSQVSSGIGLPTVTPDGIFGDIFGGGTSTSQSSTPSAHPGYPTRPTTTSRAPVSGGHDDINCDSTGVCYNVSVHCKDTRIVIMVATSRPFNGRIYAMGRSETCNVDVFNSDEFRLDLSLEGQDCNTQSGGPGIYTNLVVVQHHSVVMTKTDKIYKVRCNYDMSSKNITFGMMPIRDPAMIPITSAPEAPPPRIRILDATLKEVQTVRIGDKLTFRIEIPEDTPYGIFARSCVAMAKDSRSTFQIIDDDGCPVERSIFPEFTPSGSALQAVYEAFRFTESYGVIFQCNVKYCLGECEYAKCRSGSDMVYSFGRKRRSLRAVNKRSIVGNIHESTKQVLEMSKDFENKISKEEMSISQEILVLDLGDDQGRQYKTSSEQEGKSNYFKNASLHSHPREVTLFETCPTRSSVLALAVTCAILLLIYVLTLFYFVMRKWTTSSKHIR